MSDEKIRFEDLQFMGLKSRPAGIVQRSSRTGRPMIFDIYGMAGNVDDINNTIDSGLEAILPRDEKGDIQWFVLHPLLTRI